MKNQTAKKYSKYTRSRYLRMKKGASERNIAFAITFEEASEIYNNAKVCAYTGEEFDEKIPNKVKSFERVNNNLGYQKHNLIITTVESNSLKGEKSLRELIGQRDDIAEQLEIMTPLPNVVKEAAQNSLDDILRDLLALKERASNIKRRYIHNNETANGGFINTPILYYTVEENRKLGETYEEAMNRTPSIRPFNRLVTNTLDKTMEGLDSVIDRFKSQTGELNKQAMSENLERTHFILTKVIDSTIALNPEEYKKIVKENKPENVITSFIKNIMNKIKGFKNEKQVEAITES